jgi:hypothetical protein
MTDSSQNVAAKETQSPAATPITRPVDGAFIHCSEGTSITPGWSERNRDDITALTNIDWCVGGGGFAGCVSDCFDSQLKRLVIPSVAKELSRFLSVLRFLSKFSVLNLLPFSPPSA